MMSCEIRALLLCICKSKLGSTRLKTLGDNSWIEVDSMWSCKSRLLYIDIWHLNMQHCEIMGMTMPEYWRRKYTVGNQNKQRLEHGEARTQVHPPQKPGLFWCFL